MASDSISGILKECEAFLAVLDPQIDGNENFIRTEITGELRDAVRAPPLEDMHDRRDKTQAIIDAINDLLAALQIHEEDGGFAPMGFTLPPGLQVEYDGVISDLNAGAGVFKPASGSPTTGLEMTFLPPVDKPNPVPASAKE